MSIHNWEPGMVENFERKINAPLKTVYVHQTICPICGGARTSKIHRAMNGRCAKIMKQRANNEKETT